MELEAVPTPLTLSVPSSSSLYFPRTVAWVQLPGSCAYAAAASSPHLPSYQPCLLTSQGFSVSTASSHIAVLVPDWVGVGDRSRDKDRKRQEKHRSSFQLPDPGIALFQVEAALTLWLGSEWYEHGSQSEGSCTRSKGLEDASTLLPLSVSLE